MPGPRTALVQRAYFSGVDDALRFARALVLRHGPQRLRDVVGVRRLRALDGHVRALERTMRDAGLSRRCASCGDAYRGGCCSAALEDETDGVMLVLNRLLGVPLELQPTEDPDACRFLGPAGCTLRLKSVRCVNHICPEIHAELPGTTVAAIQRATGELLQAQVEAEQRLLGWLAEGADDPAAITDPA